MAILIGKYEFEGPYGSVCALRETPGLLAILHYEHDTYELIHLTQTENIKAHIELSKAAYNEIRGTVLLAACYTPQVGSRDRNKMVDEIQSEFDTPSDNVLDDQPVESVAS